MQNEPDPAHTRVLRVQQSSSVTAKPDPNYSNSTVPISHFNYNLRLRHDLGLNLIYLYK